MTLGEQLHAYRKASGRKVGEILDHMGIAKATLYWWEGPKSRPDPADIDRLLAFYGCTEAEIAEAQRLRRLLPAPTRARSSPSSSNSEASDPPGLASWRRSARTDVPCVPVPSPLPLGGHPQ